MLFGLTTIHTVESVKKNVVLIYIDDLRPDLNFAYGRYNLSTPNFDAFAKKPSTVTFARAFSNYPQCSPSRISTLYGREPTDTGTLTNLDDDSTKSSRANLNPSLPKFLQSQGYFTATGGKVFHEAGINGDNCWNVTYDPTITQTLSWCTNDHGARKFLYPGTRTVVSPLICITSSPLKVLPDIKMAIKAVKTLENIVKEKRFPFFLAVGFYKPHVPLQIHKKFLNMVMGTAKDAERPLPPGPINSFVEPGLSFGEDGNYVWAVSPSSVDLSVFGTSTPQFRILARTAYAAGVAQTDYGIGLVMDGLAKRNLLETTLIVMISDHSYALGENNLWAKNALFDMQLRVPMMISVPWQTSATKELTKPNRITSRFVELLDVYKTIAGLLDLPPVTSTVEGDDLSSLVKSTIQNGVDNNVIDEEDFAASIVARCGSFDACVQKKNNINAIGFSLRNVKYRYTAWMKANANRTVDWTDDSNLLTQELYDHSNDDSTIYNYGSANGVSYMTDFDNIAIGNPSKCQQLFQKLKQRFGS
jgi:iduronate 2-sulfatase